MNYMKLIYLILMGSGTLIVAGWMIVDIYGPEKMNITIGVMGLVATAWGSIEITLADIMEKLNERPK